MIRFVRCSLSLTTIALLLTVIAASYLPTLTAALTLIGVAAWSTFWLMWVMVGQLEADW